MVVEVYFLFIKEMCRLEDGKGRRQKERCLDICHCEYEWTPAKPSYFCL